MKMNISDTMRNISTYQKKIHLQTFTETFSFYIYVENERKVEHYIKTDIFFHKTTIQSESVSNLNCIRHVTLSGLQILWTNSQDPFRFWIPSGESVAIRSPWKKIQFHRLIFSRAFLLFPSDFHYGETSGSGNVSFPDTTMSKIGSF